jgi:protein-S-isoprenylcysteine O-methyltransferase Ste14
MKNYKPVAYVMLASAALIGGGGLLTFMLFLFRGSFSIIDLGLSNIQVVLFDAFLCFAFFTQHSLMARTPFRERLKVFLPSPYYGAFYAIASGIAVLILVVFWQESALTIFSIQGFMRLLFRGVFVLAIAGVAWTVFSLGFLANFRLQQIVDDLRNRQSAASLVTDRGPYRWVRHPLYLSSLLMIWSHPDLTLDRVLFNLVFTIWAIIAILLEERDLVMAFGDSYRSYQNEVPMLIPFRIKLSIFKNEPDMSV